MWKGAEITQTLHLHSQIVGGTSQHELQECLALSIIQTPGNTVIKQCGAAIGHHKQVATMKIAVENAIQHGSFQEGHHASFDNRFGINTRSAHTNGIIKLKP